MAPTLTRVLLGSVLQVAAAIGLPGVLVAYAALGRDVAIGVAAGGALIVLDGAGLIYLLGKLLDPKEKAFAKVSFMLLLLFKLVASFALLWLFLVSLAGSTLGLLFGLASGLAAIVLGATRGSSSAAGQAAIAEEEARIARETGVREAAGREAAGRETAVRETEVRDSREESR